MPEISVIMGIYNEENHEQVKIAIQSILSQTFSDFELVICDDGSVPIHSLWLQEYCQIDDRIRFCRHEKNKGLSMALNTCLQMAEGKYIARMDADDISKHNRLEKQWEYLERHSDIAMVGTGAELIDERGQWGVRILPLEPQKKDFLFGSPFIHPSVMLHREVYRALGGYCVEPYAERVEDYDLFMRMYAAGYRAVNLPDLLLEYRENSISYSRRKYRYRINEYKVRKKGFETLGIRKRNYYYIIKPLLVGLIPSSVMRLIKKFRFGER